MKNVLNHYMYKSVGFMNYDKRFIKDLKENGFKKISYDTDSIKFLQTNYHTEYLKIMFDDDSKYGYDWTC